MSDIVPSRPSQTYLSQQQKPGWLDTIRQLLAGAASDARIADAERADMEANAPDVGRTPTGRQLAMAAGMPMLVASGVAAPALTAASLGTGIAGGEVGGYTGERIAEALAGGSGSLGREVGTDVGNLIGGAIPSVGSAIGGRMARMPGIPELGPVYERPGALDARVPLPERPPLPEGPIGFEPAPVGPRLQVTEGSEIPANIRNLERPLKVSDIQRELGGLPPEGPSNIPEMADRPISAREVRDLLVKWSEFAPEPVKTPKSQPLVDAIHESYAKDPSLPEVTLDEALDVPAWAEDLPPDVPEPRMEIPADALDRVTVETLNPDEGFVNNASAESGSGASKEALNRTKAMAAQGRQFVRRGPGGQITPSNEDGGINLPPGWEFGVMGPNGFEPL